MKPGPWWDSVLFRSFSLGSTRGSGCWMRATKGKLSLEVEEQPQDHLFQGTEGVPQTGTVFHAIRAKEAYKVRSPEA